MCDFEPEVPWSGGILYISCDVLLLLLTSFIGFRLDGLVPARLRCERSGGIGRNDSFVMMSVGLNVCTVSST